METITYFKVAFEPPLTMSTKLLINNKINPSVQSADGSTNQFLLENVLDILEDFIDDVITPTDQDLIKQMQREGIEYIELSV